MVGIQFDSLMFLLPMSRVEFLGLHTTRSMTPKLVRNKRSLKLKVHNRNSYCKEMEKQQIRKSGCSHCKSRGPQLGFRSNLSMRLWMAGSTRSFQMALPRNSSQLMGMVRILVGSFLLIRRTSREWCLALRNRWSSSKELVDSKRRIQLMIRNRCIQHMGMAQQYSSKRMLVRPSSRDRLRVLRNSHSIKQLRVRNIRSSELIHSSSSTLLMGSILELERSCLMIVTRCTSQLLVLHTIGCRFPSKLGLIRSRLMKRIFQPVRFLKCSQIFPLLLFRVELLHIQHMMMKMVPKCSNFHMGMALIQLDRC